jgi:hypothetical protein
MAEVTTISRRVQVGAEAVSGTAVPADKRLALLNIEPNARVVNQTFRGVGRRFVVGQALNKQWTEAGLSGGMSYNEFPYVGCSALNTVTPVAAAGADTGAHTWTWTIAEATAITRKTYTIEVGDAVRASSFAHAGIRDFELGVSREAVEPTGTIVGKALSRGVALTAAPTAIPVVPMVGDEWSIFLDTTSAGIGTTRLTRPFEVRIIFTGLQDPLWTLDSSVTGFATLVDQPEPVYQLRVMAEADAAGDALMAAFEAEATRYVRFLSTGGLVVTGGALTHKFQIDAACKVTAVGDYADEQGVWAREYTLDIVEDSAWASGQAMVVTNVNSLAAL